MPFESHAFLIVTKPHKFQNKYWDAPEGTCLTCGKNLKSESEYHLCGTIRYLYLPDCRCLGRRLGVRCIRHQLLETPINHWPLQFRPEQL